MSKKNLLAMPLVLILSGFAFAQSRSSQLEFVSGSYMIRGFVIVPSHNHQENFEILLSTKGSEQVIEFTNAGISGEYSFINLSEGNYDIVIRLDGFKEVRESVEVGWENKAGVAVKGGNSNNVAIYDVNIILTPNDSEVVVDERLRGYPKAAIDEYVVAVDAFNAKHFESVAEHLEKVVKLAPDWFDAHCELGAAYEMLHHDVDAEREYRAALELKPDGLRPSLSLGRMLLAESDDKNVSAAADPAAASVLQRARDALQIAVQSDPNSAMASYMLGAVDFRLASYPEAELELKHALEIDPTIYPARIILINVFVEQKHWQEALDNVDAFLLENPASPYSQQVAATRISVVRRLRTPQ